MDSGAGPRPHACKPRVRKQKRTSEESEGRARGSPGWGGQRSDLLTKVLREGPAEGSPGSRVREAAPRQRDFGERSSSIRKAFKCPGSKPPLPRGLRASIMSRVPGLSKERLPVPSAAPGVPLPGFNAPRTFEKRSRRRGGHPLPPDHSPKVSRTQQRPSTQRTLMVRGRRVASPFRSQEPPPPPPPPRVSGPHTSGRAVRPLNRAQVGLLFTPTARGRGTGNTNAPIPPHHARSAPNGDARGGPQPTNRNCPGAVPDARSVAPSDWAWPAASLQSNGSAGPSHAGPPLGLGSRGL